MKKKSYNPLKMNGSWIGATVAFFLVIIPLSFFGFVGYLFAGFNFLLKAILAFLGAILTGFLIGWGIHSLFRKLKRRSH